MRQLSDCRLGKDFKVPAGELNKADVADDSAPAVASVVEATARPVRRDGRADEGRSSVISGRDISLHCFPSCLLDILDELWGGMHPSRVVAAVRPIDRAENFSADVEQAVVNIGELSAGVGAAEVLPVN